MFAWSGGRSACGTKWTFEPHDDAYDPPATVFRVVRISSGA